MIHIFYYLGALFWLYASCNFSHDNIERSAALIFAGFMYLCAEISQLKKD